MVGPLSSAAIFKQTCLCKSMKVQGGELATHLPFVNYVYVLACALVVMFHNQQFSSAIAGFAQGKKIIHEYNMSFQVEESLVKLPALSHAYLEACR